MTEIVRICAIALATAALLGLTFCVAFTDESSGQTAETCFSKMHQPVTRQWEKLAANADLPRKPITIRHVFYGNEGQIERLARAFSDNGWKTKSEPYNEIGWSAEVTEVVQRVDAAPTQRLRQMCELADSHNVLYRRWTLSAGGPIWSVSQSGGTIRTSEIP